MKVRLYNVIEFLLSITGLLLLGLVIGIALIPSILLVYKISIVISHLNFFFYLLWLGISIGTAYVLFGIVLLGSLIIYRHLFNIRSSETDIPRWSPRLFSFASFHGLLAIAEKFILPLIRGTPLIRYFYIGMGARIGKNTFINTTKISDCNLIEIGEYCIIGGDAVINGHSAEYDTLIKGRVKIGNHVTIVTYSTILPGAIIEDNVVVAANSLVLKNQILKSNKIYGGVPARLIREINDWSKQPFLGNTDETIISENLDQLKKLKTDANHSQALLLSYERLHSEIISLEAHIANLTVSSFGIMFSIIFYSIIDDKPKILAALTPLVALSAALILSTSTAMLKVAFKMCQIEIFFQAAGVKQFNWETRFGGLGSSRLRDLDGKLIFIIYGLILFAGLFLTFGGKLIPSNDVFIGYSMYWVLGLINGGLIVWAAISWIYLYRKTNSYKEGLKKLTVELSSHKS